MIEKRISDLGIALVLFALLLAACQPGLSAPTQAPVATENLPSTGATTVAPAATEAMTEAPAATEAAAGVPATTEAVTQAATEAMTEAATEGAIQEVEGTEGAGSAAGVTCSLSSADEQQLVSSGEGIYSTACAACHGPQGEGAGSFPALAGSPDITDEDPTQIIQTLTNPQVHPFADQLENEEIAGVLSFVRSEFGNGAPAVCTEQVDAVRMGP